MYRQSIGKHPAAAIGWAVLVAISGYSSAWADTPPDPKGIDATGNTKSEMQACLTGKTQQDRETCMREARNANADKKAGKLDGSSTNLDANATQRCDVLTGDEKIACEARMAGYGSTSGSVAGGGVIREVETVDVPADGSPVKVEPKTNSDTLIVIPK